VTGTGEPVERELKLAVAELDPWRQALLRLGARPVSPATLEDNRVFDRDGELARRGELLRLRSDAHGARLTFKGPARFEGPLKGRVEHEVMLASADALSTVLSALGYRVARRYQKVREEWELLGTVVALDHTPMGEFVELEGGDPIAIARRLGLDPQAADRRSYLELWDRYRAEHDGAPADMIFAARELR
jgi:adenylate cyclase class 2